MTGILDRPEVTTARWRVVIYYRSAAGLIDVEHGVEELSEIEALVECGPDWNSINRIEVTLDRVSHAALTVEQAGML
jgi:hypothetical protein